MQNIYCRIYEELKKGRIKGFFSETIVTLEGIQNIDRIRTIGGTTINRRLSQNDNGSFQLNLSVETPDRKPIHNETANMIIAALNLGMKALGAPRIGMTRIQDVDNSIYVPEVPNSIEQENRLDKYHAALTAIEARGLGRAQIEKLAVEFTTKAGVHENLFSALQRAISPAEINRVNRAVAEWADADSIASHIGYEIGYFCSNDFGRSSKETSVLSPINRLWLQEQFDVKIITLSELYEIILLKD